MNQQTHIDFERVNQSAQPLLPHLIRQWLPHGRYEGEEWVALNPLRPDRSLGSFKINLRSGKWADFATGDRGGDVISLVAYLWRIPQGQAARWLMESMGGGHG